VRGGELIDPPDCKRHACPKKARFPDITFCERPRLEQAPPQDGAPFQAAETAHEHVAFGPVFE